MRIIDRGELELIEVVVVTASVFCAPGAAWMFFKWLVKKAFMPLPKPRLRMVKKDY